MRSYINKNENQKFIEEIELSNWDINYRFPVFDESILDIACQIGNIKIIEYLLHKGAEPDSAIFKCGFNEKIIKLLVKHGANINFLDSNKKSLLCYEIKKVLNLRWNFLQPSIYSFNEKISNFNNEVKSPKNRIKFLLSLKAKPGYCGLDLSLNMDELNYLLKPIKLNFIDKIRFKLKEKRG